MKPYLERGPPLAPEQERSKNLGIHTVHEKEVHS
jgi:hypothetical protein